MNLPNVVRRADRVAKSYMGKSTCRISMYAEIVKGGNILARGCNKKGFESSVHAEIDALRQLVRQKNGSEGATITVIRYLADDSFGASMPCPQCMIALKDGGIRKINYFDYEGKFHSMRI